MSGLVQWVDDKGLGMRNEIALTVVGLASRRRADWVSHAWAVGR